MTPRRRRHVVVTAWALALGGAAACGSDAVQSSIPGADPAAGRALAADVGCASCHRIPGVAGADGRVGPPLDRFAERVYIAGELTNTPENLVRFLREPQEVRPGGAMPDMGLSDAQAADLAAYLLTLE